MTRADTIPALSTSAQPDRALVVLATGGTGGHVFPAEALARELVGRGHGVALVTDARGSAFGAGLEAVQTYRVHAGRLGGGILGKAAGAGGIARGSIQAWRLMHRLKPAAAVGFGGYASGPCMLAAVACRVPTAIHEQNAVLGRANRLLAPVVDRIATSFDEVARLGARARARAVRTGNPVRPAVVGLRGTPYPSLEGGPIRLVVLGGSQGARILSDVVPAAIALLPEGLRRSLAVVQQAREEDAERVRLAYDALGVPAEIAPFIKDAPARLAGCHLAICRSGASTVTELAALGRPAILVPYPHSLDDDQTANARAMERAGAAWLMAQPAFTAQSLAATLSRLLQDPAALGSAAAAAFEQGLPDAAALLADLVTDLIRQPGPRRSASSDAKRSQPPHGSQAQGSIKETLS